MHVSNTLIDCTALHWIDNSSPISGWMSSASVVIGWGIDFLHHWKEPLDFLLLNPMWSNLPSGEVHEDSAHIHVLLPFFPQGSLLSFYPFQGYHLLSFLRSPYMGNDRVGLSVLSHFLLAVSENKGVSLFGLKPSLLNTQRNRVSNKLSSRGVTKMILRISHNFPSCTYNSLLVTSLLHFQRVNFTKVPVPYDSLSPD